MEEFYNSYETKDTRKANNSIVGPQMDYGGNALNDFAADDGDIVLNYTPKINESEPNSLREAGARLGKFSFKQFGRQNMSNDFPIVRLSDVMLIYAEAMARRTNNWNNAETLAAVNAICKRAGVAEYSSLTAYEFLAECGREMF